MIEISTWDKVVGKLYENFIDWACMKSDAILICYQHQGRGAEEYNAKLLSIREALKPFCIKEEGDPDMKVGSTLQWPLTTSTVCRVDGVLNQGIMLRLLAPPNGY